MNDVLRQLLLDRVSRTLTWSVALLYLLLFLIALGDLTIDAVSRPASVVIIPQWTAMLLQQRAPYQFEAAAILEIPFGIFLLSPMNLTIGLFLGLQVGAQIALVRIARRCATACGLSPASGLLSGLPGLLAGSACCAPILLLVLGVQITASMVTLMGLLIPVAFLLLTISFLVTLRVAARHCSHSTQRAM